MPPPLPQPNSETQEMSRSRDSFIGPYRVEVKIGDGGMGVVYKCYDPKLKRFVAVKVLKEKYSRDEQYHERFRREAQAIASISHPNIAQIHAIEDGVPPYLVMEYVDGPSVDVLIRSDGALSPARATAIVREAAVGLREAFEKGIVHRDVKPSNLLITQSGALKIVDFGLAKGMEGTGSITDEGMVLGTPHYLSPEQGRGQKVDQRSDIYSLGATYYHLLTGQPPFDGDSQMAVIVAHLNDTPRPPHQVRQGVPEMMSHVVGKMMAKDPERRYRDYQRLIEDLDRLTRGESVGADTAVAGAATFKEPSRAVPARFWWATGLAVAAAVAATLLLAVKLLPEATGEKSRLLALERWCLRQESGVESLDLAFTSPPEGFSRPEVLQGLFLTGAGLGDQHFALDPPGPRLFLKDPPDPAPLRFYFNRLEELQLHGVRAEGWVDIAVALSHPDTSRQRLLTFTLRAGPPGASHEGAARGEGARTWTPIRAERNGSPVALEPAVPPAGLLGPGPYDIEVRFRRESGSTRLSLAVRRPGGTAETLYSSDRGEWLKLAGEDWNEGVLLLWAPSPSRPSAVSLERVLAVGLIDHRRTILSSPWDPWEAGDRLPGRTEHGEADRR